MCLCVCTHTHTHARTCMHAYIHTVIIILVSATPIILLILSMFFYLVSPGNYQNVWALSHLSVQMLAQSEARGDTALAKPRRQI